MSGAMNDVIYPNPGTSTWFFMEALIYTQITLTVVKTITILFTCIRQSLLFFEVFSSDLQGPIE